MCWICFATQNWGATMFDGNGSLASRALYFVAGSSLAIALTIVVDYTIDGNKRFAEIDACVSNHWEQFESLRGVEPSVEDEIDFRDACSRGAM